MLVLQLSEQEVFVQQQMQEDHAEDELTTGESLR